MPQASEWLVEIGADTGSGTTTLRYSSCGFTSKPADVPANTHYAMRISDAGTVSRHLFGSGRTLGEAEMQMGDLALGNRDGKLDPLLDYAVDGRPIVLRRLPSARSPLAAATEVYRATVERFDADSGSETIRVRHYDRRREIDKPIQVNRYGGTTISGVAGGADGTADMKDQLKPLVYGRVRNVVPVIADPFNLVLQVNDGAVAAILLYDGGILLTNDGDVATLAELVAATINPGRYKTCLSLGLVRPGGSFQGKAGFVWTADVAEGTALDAGSVVQRMLARMGIIGSDNVDAASFAAFSAEAPQEVGIFLDSETSGISAMRQVLESVGGSLLPAPDGRFTLYRFAGVGAPVATIRQRDIIGDVFGLGANSDTDGGLPASEIRLKWGRNYHVHGENDIAGNVTEDQPDRAAALRKEWREIVLPQAGVTAAHPLATELEIETLLANEADAQAEAARRGSLYGVDRFVTQVTVPREVAALCPLNETVTLMPDLLIAGRDMCVIGEDQQLADEIVTLTLWG